MTFNKFMMIIAKLICGYWWG